MQNKNFRFIMWVIFIFFIFLLLSLWFTVENRVVTNTEKSLDKSVTIEDTVDNILFNTETTCNTIKSDFIQVLTDIFSISIDRYGGDIHSLKLLKYPSSLDHLDEAFSLLEITDTHFCMIQTGLLNNNGPDSRTKGRSYYNSDTNFYNFTDTKDYFVVDLYLKLQEQNISIKKRFCFTKNSYLITIQFFITNNSVIEYETFLFGQLKKKYYKKDVRWYKSLSEVQNYEGAALSTDKKLFSKISYNDMDKKNLSVRTKGGWVAFVEHYFICSLIPSTKEVFNEFSTEQYKNNIYSISFVESDPILVKSNKTEKVELHFYAGPKISSELKKIIKGLELTLDYGILWFIAQPIFIVLKFINNNFTHNWGFSIIFITFIIRLVFLPLSAYSYKAMARLRQIQPKIVTIKDRYKDDKQKFSNALMALYKKENINPFGGCLPVLVQIPVFISLYYVLLQSVELRMAPFVLWIHDLSMYDHYYVLPILLGISMFLQQKLNPQPVDFFQEKLLYFMPFVLTLLFLQFASGLVLYWFVNNIFSILQQWYILKKVIPRD